MSFRSTILGAKREGGLSITTGTSFLTSHLSRGKVETNELAAVLEGWLSETLSQTYPLCERESETKTSVNVAKQQSVCWVTHATTHAFSFCLPVVETSAAQ